MVDAAIEAGVTFFDTANIYGDAAAASGCSASAARPARPGRVATKFGGDIGDGVEARGAPAYVPLRRRSLAARLQTDHVDLLYYHLPDGVTPIAETIGAMDELVEAGKMRALGVSNLDAAQLEERSRTRRSPPLQNEYSPARARRRARRPAALPRARRRLRAVLPARGRAAAGQVQPRRAGTGRDAPARAGDDALGLSDAEGRDRAALRRGRAPRAFARPRPQLLELAIAALASQPGVASVIAGATSAEQVRANAAAGSWRLDAGELAELAGDRALDSRHGLRRRLLPDPRRHAARARWRAWSRSAATTRCSSPSTRTSRPAARRPCAGGDRAAAASTGTPTTSSSR